MHDVTCSLPTATINAVMIISTSRPGLSSHGRRSSLGAQTRTQRAEAEEDHGC